MQKTRGGAAEQFSEKRPELFRYLPLDEMFLGNAPKEWQAQHLFTHTSFCSE
jgi:hypothetical protein